MYALDIIMRVLNSPIPRLHSPAFIAWCRKVGREPGTFQYVHRNVECACILKPLLACLYNVHGASQTLAIVV